MEHKRPSSSLLMCKKTHQFKTDCLNENLGLSVDVLGTSCMKRERFLFFHLLFPVVVYLIYRRKRLVLGLDYIVLFSELWVRPLLQGKRNWITLSWLCMIRHLCYNLLNFCSDFFFNLCFCHWVNSKWYECLSVGVFLFFICPFCFILKHPFLLEKHFFVVLPSPYLLFHEGLLRMLKYANPWQQEGKGSINFLGLWAFVYLR